jgi:hypothetical protein
LRGDDFDRRGRRVKPDGLDENLQDAGKFLSRKKGRKNYFLLCTFTART